MISGKRLLFNILVIMKTYKKLALVFGGLFNALLFLILMSIEFDLLVEKFSSLTFYLHLLIALFFGFLVSYFLIAKGVKQK